MKLYITEVKNANNDIAYRVYQEDPATKSSKYQTNRQFFGEYDDLDEAKMAAEDLAVSLRSQIIVSEKEIETIQV